MGETSRGLNPWILIHLKTSQIQQQVGAGGRPDVAFTRRNEILAGRFFVTGAASRRSGFLMREKTGITPTSQDLQVGF